MQEPGQGAVDVQGTGSAEACAGKQGGDVFERAQGAEGAERERGGQGPGHQQRHDVRVGQRQLPAAAGDGAQLRGPAGAGGIHLELRGHGPGGAAGQRRLVGRMAATATPATARSLQRCSRSPHTRSRDHARISDHRRPPWATGPRILLSRSEASVEERSWAGHDRRDVTRRCCAIFGAGRVRCVAACGVPARSGLPRHRLPSGRLPRVPSRPRRARANGRAREQRRGCAGGRVSGLGADPAGLARRWSRGVRAHPAARGGVPAFPRGNRRLAGGVSVRCRHGDACCTQPSA